MTSKFQKFGLRRDKNLSDINDKDISLQNLLNGLTVSNEIFLPEDIRVIEGISDLNITTDDFIGLRGTSRTYIPNGQTSSELLKPLVTIKDNIQNFKVIVEDPPVTRGGTGPDAFFYPGSSIKSYSSINSLTANSSLTSDDIFDNSNRLGPFDFWENGSFSLLDKINTSFTDSYGGILWEGYLSDSINIRVRGSCFFHIEQDLFDDDNWKTIRSYAVPTRSVTAENIEYVGGTTNISLSENDIRKLLIGDRISTDSSYIISDIDMINNTVTIPVDITGDYATNDEIDFVFVPGTEIEYITPFDELSKISYSDRVKTRICVWWPNPSDYTEITNSFYDNKTFYFDSTGSGSGGRIFPYSLFYKISSNTDIKEFSYRYFDKKRVGNLNKYTDFPISVYNNMNISYIPETSFSEKMINSSKIGFYPIGRGRLKSATGFNFNDINVSDWLVFKNENDDLTYCLQVKEKIDSQNIFVDRSIYNESSEDIHYGVFFKNVGLTGIYQSQDGVEITELNGETFSINDIDNDDFIGYVEFAGANNDIYHSNVSNNFLRILSSNNVTNNSIDVFTQDFISNTETISVTENSIIATYSSSGLKDNSFKNQCVGVYGSELSATANSGQNIVELLSTNSISVGDYVQFGSNVGSVVPVNTTVSNVVNNSVIELSNNLLSDIQKNSTLIFIESSAGNPGSNNKTQCVIPLNLAPPFQSTSEGISTTTSYPSISANNIFFEEIDMEIDSTNDLSSVDNFSTLNYTETIDLIVANTTYKMFID